MKRSATLAIVAALLFVPAIALKHQTVAYVEALRGEVFLQTVIAGQEIRLTPETDRARALQEGDRIRCGRDGWARLRLGRQIREVGARSSVVVALPPTTSREVERALDEYGRTGGRSREDSAEGIRLYSPAPDSAVVPTTFDVRWAGGSRDCPVALVIENMNRDVLWRQASVESETSVNASAARDALSKYRTSGGEPRLEMTLAADCAGDQRVTFELLSTDEEASLHDELRAWLPAGGDKDEMFIHLGRASVYARHRLYPESAAEYEVALRFAPQSHDLLARTISAHDRTGNVQRRIELQKRMKDLP